MLLGRSLPASTAKNHDVRQGSRADVRHTGDMDVALEDEALAKLSANGDRDAFARLLERHYDRIYRIAYHLLGARTDAEDLAQEVCVALPRKLKGFRGDSRFTTWLYSVVVNAGRDALRRRQASARAVATFCEVSALLDAGRAVRQTEVAWLYEALEALNDSLRETAVLVLSEELSHAEAGTVLGVKESTVSWRMHEVRKRLKTLACAGEGASL